MKLNGITNEGMKRLAAIDKKSFRADIDKLRQDVMQEVSSYPAGALSEEELAQVIDEVVQQTVEMPAAEQSGLDFGSSDVYDTLENVDEVRDLQNEILYSLKMASKKSQYVDDNDEIFYRLDDDGNAYLLYTDGEPVTRLDANVYPIGSEVSARYEHPEGIVLSLEDAKKLGVPSEDEMSYQASKEAQMDEGPMGAPPVQPQVMEEVMEDEPMEEASERAQALAQHLSISVEEVEAGYDDESFDAEGGEYRVLTDEEADAAWEESLDNYIEEEILPEFPKQWASYFDSEKWKQDAKFDGRGHSLSHYDGSEEEEQVNGVTYYIYQTN